ncbi:MAG TPA: BON domain-containing protein [Thermoanaerobaculia bacterium]|jgi:osmotically-inducible protein OsmY|nr:BON domain-containing protein [Thermoanaerobaculia bacterium]
MIRSYLPPTLVLLAFLTAGCAGTVSPQRSATERSISDASLQADVYVALLEKLGRDGLPIDVSVTNGRVMLTGNVDQRSTQELAEEVVLSVPGVRGVDNRVTAPSGSAAQTAPGQAADHVDLEVQDATLEARVKKNLLAEIGRYAFELEIEASSGVVSLRGTLPDQERKTIALRAAEKTSGVKKVIDLLRVR